MSGCVMIVGAGVLQEPAIKTAREMGLEVLATDIVPDAPGLKWADYVEMVSKFDVEGHIEVAKKYAAKTNLRGVMTIGTDVSFTVACVAKALGLPGIKPESAIMATNKARMRARLKECGVQCPDFVEVSTLEDALDAGESLGYPVVIKPVDNMGARGVRRLDDEWELVDFFPVSQENSRSGKVIIEEYMEGDEVSIDTLVYDGKVHLLTIADRHISYAPYFVEIGHTIPSALPWEKLDDIFNMMKQGIDALGIDIGASKGDIRVTADGARIGEMTARMSGGFHCQRTDPLATGMNTIKGAIDLAIGNPLDLADITPRWHRASAERAIIPKPGRVVDVRGVDEALDQEGITDVIINVKIGDIVRRPVSNMGKAGHIISVGETREEAIARVNRALETVRIVTEPIKDELEQKESAGHGGRRVYR
jgi:biotin carboxylase